MSLEWPLAPHGGLFQSHHSTPQEDANRERPENAHETHVYIFLMTAFDVLLGVREGSLGLQPSHNFPVSRNTSISVDLPRTMM